MSKLKSNQHIASLQEFTWRQIREEVWKVNPSFAEIVDNLDPSDKYTIHKARYPYGSEILKRALLYLPDANGGVVPITSNHIDPKIRQDLNYNSNSNPVTMVLKNSVELFFSLEGRTISLYDPLDAGKIFGTWRILNPSKAHQPIFIWNMTAGARSIFMLPKITETEKHYRLKKAFHLDVDAPKNLIDHWGVFKELVNHPEFPEPWSVEVIFFSRKWFEHLDDKAWINFNYYLLKAVWEGSEFWRNYFFWNILFSTIKEVRGLKPSPYIDDTVKYLFFIGIGAVTGFCPATNSEVAPIAGLQKVYIDFYNLKKYLPVIMRPNIFAIDSKKPKPVYYSLQFPNAVEFSPKTRDRSSFITDLYEIRSLLNKYLVEILSGQFNVEETPLYKMAKNVNFDYFHNNVQQYPGMKESALIPIEDPNFFVGFDDKNIDLFPANSAFVKGCIRISQK